MKESHVFNAFYSFGARLKDLESLNLLKEIFLYHGVLGKRELLNKERNNNYSELDRLRITPLIFGLMPLQAISRESISNPIKDYIISHLDYLGIRADQLLINVIKEVSDQFYQSKSSKQHKKSKYSLSKVIQAHSQIYEKLKQAQNNRCAVCGFHFTMNQERDSQPTLDHCIPWNLIGDPSDGSNWQILCKDCNNAKYHYISHFQFDEILNWVYSERRETLISSQPSKQTRYIVLTRKNCCEYPSCVNNKHNSQLFVISDENSLPVVDHCKVYCSYHYHLKQELDSEKF